MADGPRIEFNLARPLPENGQRLSPAAAAKAPPNLPTREQVREVRSAATTALHALNTWRDAGERFGLGSPQEQQARAQFQRAERERTGAHVQARSPHTPAIRNAAGIEQPRGARNPLYALIRRSYEASAGAIVGAKEKLTPLAERTAKARGFLWERIKGISTFGVYEYLQGFRVSSKTHELANLIEQDEQRIVPDEHIWELARLQREASGIEKMNEQERAALDMHILETFIRPAYRRNEEVINEMVWAGMELYKDRMKRVRRTMTGESPLSERRLAQVQKELRVLLRSRADVLGRRKVGEFSRELKRLTDPHWRWRFGFGAIETALAAWGLIMVAKGAAASGTSAAAAETVPVPTQIPPGLDAPARDLFVEMHKNVWSTVKQYALTHNRALSNEQLMPIVREVLDVNHLAEPEWLMDMAGNASTRQLPEGFILNFNKLSSAAQALLGIAP